MRLQRAILATCLAWAVIFGCQAQAATPATTPAATKAPAAATTPSSTPAAKALTPAVTANVSAPATASAALNVTATQPTPSSGAAPSTSTGLLTTKASKSGPTIIVDEAGNEVNFKGIGWYGFNIGLTAPGNLSLGIDAVSNDFKQVVYRMRMLGFNAIRLAFSFDDTWGLGQPPLSWTATCPVPTNSVIEATLVPSSAAATTVASDGDTVPPVAPPTVPGGVCNSEWPNDSTYSRFLWVVDYLISQGFYVMLDFHSNRYGNSLASGNESLYDQASWIQSWVALVKSVLTNTPAANGKLLIDLINEPDGYALTWETQDEVPSLGSYYLNTITALYAVCPGCLFLIEGTGQSTYCGVNWGNGFITDPSLVSALQITDPTSFFTSALSEPWINQVVLAPHIYCPEVSGATSCFSGTSLYDSLDKSFGYLTVAPGFCANTSSCRVFPVLLDEFGSTLNNANETTCMTSIIAYATGTANPTTHAPLTSWFWWAWNPDSAGTGGIVEDDWRTIIWEKIGLLTGGTKQFATGLGMLPWYLKGFQDLTPIATTLSSGNSTTTTVAIAPKAAVPVEAPVLGAAAPITSLAGGTQAQQQQATPTPTIPAGFISGNETVSSPNGPETSIAQLSTFSGGVSLASKGSSLSAGALAGIVVGGVVFLAAIAAAAILIIKLRNPVAGGETYTPTSGSQSPPAPGSAPGPFTNAHFADHSTV